MNMQVNISDGFNQLSHLFPEQAEKIKSFISQTFNYEPKIGIMGKTGVGKSSLCNALFGKDVADVSDVESCTRTVQEIKVQVGTGNIILVDLPGIGESRERDKEYSELYAKKLPELDVVLWVLKADDKAFSSDEEFYHNIVKPHLDQGKPFIIVLNQIEKVEPSEEWDYKNSIPMGLQKENIDAKKKGVAEKFALNINAVIPISCKKKYNLITLVETITYAIPKEKKITFLNSVKDENRSKKAKEEAKRGFYEGLFESLSGRPGKDLGKRMDTIFGKDPLVNVVDLIANWFFSWW